MMVMAGMWEKLIVGYRLLHILSRRGGITISRK